MRNADPIRSATAREGADEKTRPFEWRTRNRISHRRGLGYCVVEVHEFDVEIPGAPPRTTYRVYHEIHGFSVGDPLASFSTREAAQRYAEALGNDLPGSATRLGSA